MVCTSSLKLYPLSLIKSQIILWHKIWPYMHTTIAAIQTQEVALTSRTGWGGARWHKPVRITTKPGSRKATKKRLVFERLISLLVIFLRISLGCHGRVVRWAVLPETHILIARLCCLLISLLIVRLCCLLISLHSYTVATQTLLTREL